jgi:hypothetical protein
LFSQPNPNYDSAVTTTVKTSRPKIAGILTIISGVFGALGILNYWIGFGAEGSGFGKGDIPPFVPSIIFSLPVPALVLALVAIVGSFFIPSRKKWRWGMVGAVAAVLSFLPTGIPALILTGASKEEFS